MEKQILNVTGMTCGHCANRVKKALGALNGVTSVAVDLAGKRVEVEYEPASVNLTALKNAIEEQGYGVQ